MYSARKVVMRKFFRRVHFSVINRKGWGHVTVLQQEALVEYGVVVITVKHLGLPPRKCRFESGRLHQQNLTDSI